MLKRGDSWEAVRRAFRWEIPDNYNIARDACDRWAEAEPGRVALIDAGTGGAAREVSYAELRELSERIGAVLAAQGVGPGDRVGVLLPQRVETAAAHLAAWRMGAISLPLFTLFGPEALRHRLADSGAAAVLTDGDGARKLAGLRDELPGLRTVLSVDGPGDGVLGLREEMARAGAPPGAVGTRDDPALLIYTSGTTGQPKGALHAHRVLPGHLPGVEISHDFLPAEGDRLWTPADWAWIGGLLDVLMPGLHYGVPVVACRFPKFTAAAALDLMRDLGVRNTFLPPTALKLIRGEPRAAEWGLSLRSVASGGEPLGAELLDWGRRVFGVTINEFYGQTECNMTVSSCAALEPPEPGAIGRAVPGHEVAVVDPETGQRAAPGALGTIAVKAPDPVMFLGYWNRPEATAEKFVDGPEGRWLLTGDTGLETETGRIRFVGRDDDVITSGGYRIGPTEIEDCLIGHPAVALAGVVGRPDPVRGEAVAAFVQLAEGVRGSDALKAELQAHVRDRLAAHEYPRSVTFVDEMPLTTTGKIIRARLRDWAGG